MKDNWTTTQLALQIRERQGKTSHGGRNPNPTVPVGAQGALRELQWFIDQWEAHFQKWIEPHLAGLIAKKADEVQFELGRVSVGLHRVQREMGQTRAKLGQFVKPGAVPYKKFQHPHG